MALAACGDGKADAVKKMAEADSVRTDAIVVDLAQHGIPLVVQVPAIGTTMPPVATFNENSGKLEFRAGERFAFTVVEDPGDLALEKAELERDLLKRNTVVRETAEELVYRSEFPDDPALTYMHFLKVIQADGRTFLVEDIHGETKLEQEDVERMITAVQAAAAS